MTSDLACPQGNLEGCCCAAPYPQEFRDDVVRTREADTRLAQIAKDFGIFESCLTNWVCQAEIEAGNTPGATKVEAEE